MMKYRKVYAFAAAIILLMGFIPDALAASHPFADVSESSWYASSVEYCYRNNLMMGTGENRFEPELIMTRGMLVTVLYRLAGEPIADPDHPFKDVQSGIWYSDAVSWAYEKGIAEGMTQTTFCPDLEVSREQMVTFFYRFADAQCFDVQNETDLSGFEDHETVSAYAVTSFRWAVANEIVLGVNANRLDPKGNASRAQCATILQRFILWTETAHQHDFLKSDEAVAPTCTQYGYTVYSCTCGAKRTMDTVAAYGHTWNGWKVVTEPSFDRDGEMSRSCAVCSVTDTKSIAAFSSNPYIIHAAGFMNGYVSTNSLEALENAYNQGNRLIELDFNWTTDGYLACIHGWHYRFSSGISGREALSLEDFLDCRIYDKFSPLWLGTLADYMREHPDLYIVTDVKDSNVAAAQMIRESCPDLLNRFVIQVFSESEYMQVRSLGFDKIIFTLYNCSWSEKTDTARLVQFAQEHPLFAYTFPYELCSIENYVERMLAAGVPLLVHTVNDIPEQTRYFEMGISGIYTDNTIHP